MRGRSRSTVRGAIGIAIAVGAASCDGTPERPSATRGALDVNPVDRHSPGLRRWLERGRSVHARLHRVVQPGGRAGFARGLVAAVRERDRDGESGSQREPADRAARIHGCRAIVPRARGGRQRGRGAPHRTSSTLRPSTSVRRRARWRWSAASLLGCNGGSTPCGAAEVALIVDLVGYGNANFFESACGADAGQRPRRPARGWRLTDSNDNAADFRGRAGTPQLYLAARGVRWWSGGAGGLGEGGGGSGAGGAGGAGTGGAGGAPTPARTRIHDIQGALTARRWRELSATFPASSPRCAATDSSCRIPRRTRIPPRQKACSSSPARPDGGDLATKCW